MRFVEQNKKKVNPKYFLNELEGDPTPEELGRQSSETIKNLGAEIGRAHV